VSRAIEFYDQRAQRYRDGGGFAPVRKQRLVKATLRLLLSLTPPGGTLLELGTGAGSLTRHLIDSHHFQTVHATDGSEAMLAIARNELPDDADTTIRFATLDFTTQWADDYQAIGHDAVTSAMALHHAIDKAALFAQVLAVLKPGGVFVFGDHMDGNSPWTQDILDRERALIHLGQDRPVTPARIQATMAEARERDRFEGNHCESVPAYLSQLKAVGFADADCLWRDYWLAVFVARKPE
jgi:ubiquinone/menaquinone biosynthesis C-methylase UbiE